MRGVSWHDLFQFPMQDKTTGFYTLPFDDLALRYASALDRLRSWDVRFGVGSRLLVYQDLIQTSLSKRGMEWSRSDLATWAADLRIVAEIIEIVEAFTDTPTLNELALLKRIATGPARTTQDSQMSALEAQYELYLRSVARAAGLNVTIGDPDLRITLEGHTVPLEAKRPRRLKRFDDNLRRGIRQVEAKGQFGIVAISLDMLAWDPRILFEVPSQDDTRPRLARLIHEVLRTQHSSLVNRTEPTTASGLLLTLRLGVFRTDDQGLAVSSALYLLGLQNEPSPVLLALAAAIDAYSSRAS